MWTFVEDNSGLLSVIAIGFALLAIGIAAAKSQQRANTDAKVEKWVQLVYQLATRYTFGTAVAIAIAVFLIGWAGRAVLRTTRPSVITIPGGITVQSGTRRDHVQLVHPLGWQRAIPVRKGDAVSIRAHGKVTVGYVEYIWDLLSLRLSPECREVVGGRLLLRQTGVSGCNVGATPEARRYRPKWDWVGPSGYASEMYKSDLRYAANDYTTVTDLLLAGVPHGALVGALTAGNDALGEESQLSSDRGFFIGEDMTTDVTGSGYLWLAVNDAADFRYDNQGVFVVTITVN